MNISPRFVAAAAGLAGLLAAPSGAAAQFVPVSPPCPGQAVAGFAASGGSWLVNCFGSSNGFKSTLALSVDRGLTWQPVPWTPELGAPVSAGVTARPEGGFVLSAVSGTTGRLVTVTTAGVLTALPGAVPVAAQSHMSTPRYGPDGALWVGWIGGVGAAPLLSVGTYASDGTVTAVGAPVPAASIVVNPRLYFGPSGVWASASEAFPPGVPARYRLDNGTWTPVEAVPSFEQGEVATTTDSRLFAANSYSTYGTSLDAGRTWSSGQSGIRAVDGAPDLIVSKEWSQTRILSRYRSGNFEATGLMVPSNPSDVVPVSVVAVDGGLVAVTDVSAAPGPLLTGADARLFFHAGSPDPLPATIGVLSPLFTTWLARANGFRAAVDLPPLVGDATISAAAENHSTYSALNPGLNHSETPGTQGFTGTAMTDRCRAVGTTCNGEVMGGGNDPVADWIATTYHRGLFMGPVARVGGGRTTGRAVVDGEDYSSFRTTPFMFPRGQYDGYLSFGGESPDPGAACPSGKPPEPYGTDIQFSPPTGSVLSISVATGGAPLPGCLLRGNQHYLPAKPLQPFTTYQAVATWKPSATAPDRTTPWSFTTGADTRESGFSTTSSDPTTTTAKCRPSIRVKSNRLQRGKPINVLYTSCAAGTATVTVSKIKGRRVTRVLRRLNTIRDARSGIFTVPTSGLAPRQYRVEVVLDAGGRRLATTTLRLSKPSVAKSSKKPRTSTKRR